MKQKQLKVKGERLKVKSLLTFLPSTFNLQSLEVQQ
jgi:hypothetical protein